MRNFQTLTQVLQNLRLWPRQWLANLRSSYPLITLTIGQTAMISSVVVTGGVALLRHFAVLQPLEVSVYDQFVRWQPSPKTDPRLLIVAITEADLQDATINWPLSDQDLANVLAILQQHQPRVIGLDIYRNLPRPPGTTALTQQLGASNVIAIEKLSNLDEQAIPAPLSVPKERVGFNDFVKDADAVVRRNWMFSPIKPGQELFSFSLRVSLAYLIKDGRTMTVDENFLTIGEATFPRLRSNSGGYQDIDASGYQILIDDRAGGEMARQISLKQILMGQFDPAWIEDKIVLIGSTAPSLKDQFQTSRSAAAKYSDGTIPGVALHAKLVSQILNCVLDGQCGFWFWNEWGELGWTWCWALLGGLLAWWLRHPLHLGIAGAIVLASLTGSCYGLFLKAGWVPIVSPALAFILTAGSAAAYRSFYQTFYHALTHLPNRFFFLQHLQRAIDRLQVFPDAQMAVLLIGLDGFAMIQNSLGSSASDQLLSETSHRLNIGLNRRKLLAYTQGHEFAILLENLGDGEEPIRLAEQLHQAMAKPFALSSQEVFTNLNIGITIHQTDHTCKAEELLQNARTAMDYARRGNDRHEIFASGMRLQVVRRLQLETDLRYAIDSQAFQLHYQPIVCLKTNQIAGFEALLRWHHPQHGWIAPIEFIPVAEETGLIVPIGEWILKTACEQLCRWQAQFPANPPLMVSVNLSSQQLSQATLVTVIEQILQANHFNGLGLKLELTESIAMSDAEATISLLQRLKALNLGLSIDDFGTGYSSLSYLHRFPLDTLKIDRSFVNQLGETEEAKTIVQAILVLGHTLGFEVVAEGIETAIQRDILRSLGCNYGQGYLFSRPLTQPCAEQLLLEQLPHSPCSTLT